MYLNRKKMKKKRSPTNQIYTCYICFLGTRNMFQAKSFTMHESMHTHTLAPYLSFSIRYRQKVQPNTCNTITWDRRHKLFHICSNIYTYMQVQQKSHYDMLFKKPNGLVPRPTELIGWTVITHQCLHACSESYRRKEMKRSHRTKVRIMHAKETG